jgi:hypothetical protein
MLPVGIIVTRNEVVGQSSQANTEECISGTRIYVLYLVSL